MRPLLVLLIALGLPAFAQTDPQQLIQKAQSGQKLSPEEVQQLRDYYTGQAMKAQPGLSPEQQELVDKKKRGEKLSPDDIQRLKDSYLRKAGDAMNKGNAGAARGLSFMAAVEAATPKENPSVHVDQRPPLDAGGYLALVKQLQAEASDAVGADRASKLLAAAKGKQASSLGVMLTFAPDGPPASALALTAAALAEPKSAKVASNLSVAVYNANFFERAYDLATWADKLKPSDANITSNRAWPALYLGDFKTAEKLFNQALQLDPKLADAHTGLALLAKGRGDLVLAASQGKQAAEGGAGGLVDTILSSEGRHNLSDDQRAELTPMVDEPGYASMGGVVYDSSAGAGFSYPVWTIPPNPHDLAPMIPIYGATVIAEKDKLQAIVDERKQKDLAYAQAAQARQVGMTATGVVYPRRNPRLLILIDDLQGIYDARMLKVEKEIDKALPEASKQATLVANQLLQEMLPKVKACGDDDNCQKQVAYEYCTRRQTEAKKIHAAAGEAYGKAIVKQRDLMNEFWKKSDPLVNGIADPDLQHLRELDRRVMLYKYLLASRTEVGAWLSAVASLDAGDCGSPPPPPDPEAVKEAKKEPVTPDPKPGQCVPPPNSCGLGPVNVSWDCGGFKIEGGEGLFAGVEVKFAGQNHKGTLSGHTETTVFAGFGEGMSIGKASGKAAATISFTQAQGQVVDVGAKYETSVKAEGFGAKASAGAELDWSMRAGPNSKFGTQGSFADHSLWNAGDKL